MKSNKQNLQLDEHFFPTKRNIHILKYQTFSFFFFFDLAGMIG